MGSAVASLPCGRRAGPRNIRFGRWQFPRTTARRTNLQSVRVIPRCRLAASTANNPPISAPTMVFPPIKYRGSRQCGNHGRIFKPVQNFTATTAPSRGRNHSTQRFLSSSKSPLRLFAKHRYIRNAIAYASGFENQVRDEFREPRGM